MPGMYDLSQKDVAGLLEGEPAYRLGQVWDALYARAEQPREMTALPVSVREHLERVGRALTPIAEHRADGGDTVKWLLRLDDGESIETVLMRYDRRVTVCVSTQAGCAMGCSFCATGQAGFSRHLSAGEILEQVALARRAALPDRLSNVVFMGMGEPLANFDRVWTAVERLHADVGISARHLTISTVGLVPGILRLAAETLPVGLAVSLHAANDELRSTIVPINKRYPIRELVGACEKYVSSTGRRLSFEWALIDGVNDTSTDAVELSRIALPLRAHVNLIPLNSTPGYPVRGSTRARVREFRSLLETLGVNATIRSTRGADIDAACGQLSGSRRTRSRPGLLQVSAAE